MQTLTTNTFSIAIPALFDQTRIIHESVKAENTTADYTLLSPTLTAGLDEVAFFDRFEGDSLYARFKQYCLANRYNATVAEEDTVALQGKTAHTLWVASTAEWEGQTVAMLYFCATIQVGEAHCYTVLGECEQSVANTYRPVFQAALESLSWFGDRAGALAAQNKALGLPQQPVPPKAPPTLPPFAIPEDGQDTLQVAGVAFAMAEAPECHIAVGNHGLQVVAKATMPGFKQNKKQKLLSPYRNGQVSLSLTAKGVFYADGPQCAIDIEADRPQPGDYTFRHDGWDYGLSFTGRVAIRSGWLGIDGYLHDFSKERQLPLRCYARLPLSQIVWEDYQFTSLAEAQRAPVALVRRLMLSAYSEASLPEAIFGLSALTNLNVSCRKPRKAGEAAGLSTLSDGIARLAGLAELYISNARLARLPEAVAQLPALKRLGLHDCGLETVPWGVWHMPTLNYLGLARNALRQVPESIQLPALNYIDLSHNQLATLPEALVRLPQLKTAKIQHNPFTKLPDALLGIEGLDMGIDDKLRFFDYAYPGADGQGTGAYDAHAFMARHYPALQAALHETIKAQGMEAYHDALDYLGRATVKLAHAGKEDYANLGNTRFGGMPDLPDSIAYPRYYSAYDKREYAYEFIAQVNCAELAPLQNYLPREGMIYFFLKSFHDLECHVAYAPPGGPALKPGTQFDFQPEDFYDMVDAGHDAFKATASVVAMLPHFYSDDLYYKGPAAVLAEADRKLEDQLYDLGEALQESGQKRSHEINSYVFTQHEPPEEQAAQALRGDPADWMVLLNTRSLGSFQWGDAGDLFFVIHKSDLAKRDFSNVFVSLESS